MEKDAEKARKVVSKFLNEAYDKGFEPDMENLIEEALSQARSEGYENGVLDQLGKVNECLSKLNVAKSNVLRRLYDPRQVER